MVSRQTVESVLYEEWDFDDREELEAAIKKEARICGDEIRGDTIFNHHPCDVRWRGKVKGE